MINEKKFTEGIENILKDFLFEKNDEKTKLMLKYNIEEFISSKITKREFLIKKFRIVFKEVENKTSMDLSIYIKTIDENIKEFNFIVKGV